MWDQQQRRSIVCNPPFAASVPFVQRGLELVDTGGIVAIIAQAKFLFSQARHPLFSRSETERVVLFSRRPSMPPGATLVEQGEACRGGGAMDYCWCIWRVGKAHPGVLIEWAL